MSFLIGMEIPADCNVGLKIFKDYQITRIKNRNFAYVAQECINMPIFFYGDQSMIGK